MRLTDDQLENLIKLEPNDLLMGLFTELLELRAELELRRKVMADIPCRCGHCGCDWDYEAKEQG